MDEVETLLAAVHRDLGDPQSWGVPVEFRDSLALCAPNSAYSLRATTPAVQNVLARYRTVRPTADTDSGTDLITAMDDAGGPETFAREVLRNRSVLPGTSRVRTRGIQEALTNLANLVPAVVAAKELRAAVRTDLTAARRAWTSVSGLGPLSWSYLIMNAGIDTVAKPDVMVQRYLAQTLGPPRNERPHPEALLADVAARRGVPVRSLDRAIWLLMSPHSDQREGPSCRRPGRKRRRR